MNITVDSKLRDRCADFINRPRGNGSRLADDLHAFVLAEIGRAANEKLADSSALVLFFANPEGAEQVFQAIQGAKPGLVERKWP